MLVKYNKALVPEPFGLINIGATCYFNSFIQAMLSLPSVSEFFLYNEESLRSNAVATAYIAFLKHVRHGTSSVQSVNPSLLFRAFVEAIHRKNPRSNFGSGQEDADEALTHFLDAIDEPGLYKLFMSTYNLVVLCYDCQQMTQISADNSCVIEVTPEPQMPVLSEKIRKYTVSCPGYKCPKCEKSNVETPPQTLYRLCNVGTVITVLFRKYNTPGVPISYQQTIELPGNDEVLTFRLVAIIEHSGSTSGGHYWSRCLRSGGFALLNDSSVGPGDDYPRSESYVLFYHYI